MNIIINDEIFVKPECYAWQKPCTYVNTTACLVWQTNSSLAHIVNVYHAPRMTCHTATPLHEIVLLAKYIYHTNQIN